MIREIIQTKDGSSSVAIPEMNVTYHSIHGAWQESMHVFIDAGLMPLIDLKQWGIIHVFEMGLGTGLNALLTAEQALLHQQKIHYSAIELFPLQIEEAHSLNYNNASLLLQIHQCNWEEDVKLNDFFYIA